MREQFLHAPPLKMIRDWGFDTPPPLPDYNRHLEAQCSSWIEGERNYASNLTALEYLESMEYKPLTLNVLNNAHGILLRGKDNRYPGQFRPYNVTVGDYRPPKWELVPALMEEFEEFLTDTTIPLMLRATWGHIYFETIHPYADGNGRMGRMIVNALLTRPWSTAVFNYRSEYCKLLSHGHWYEWVLWMALTLELAPTEKPGSD